MALLKYLQREGLVCECGALSKKTEQVDECMSPLVPSGENAKAYQSAVRKGPLYWLFSARS